MAVETTELDTIPVPVMEYDPGKGPIGVLVVEDKKDLAGLYKTQADFDPGVSYLFAPTLQAAREALTRAPGQIHLVICDRNLPDGKGEELAQEEVRRHQQDRSPRPTFLINTTMGPDEHASLVGLPGIDGVNAKVTDIRTLVAGVSSAAVRRPIPSRP